MASESPGSSLHEAESPVLPLDMNESPQNSPAIFRVRDGMTDKRVPNDNTTLARFYDAGGLYDDCDYLAPPLDDVWRPKPTEDLKELRALLKRILPHRPEGEMAYD